LIALLTPYAATPAVITATASTINVRCCFML
jgi:hypothetical protein